jgi:hypothetical protein
VLVRIFLVIVAVALALGAPAVSVSVDADGVAEIERGPGGVDVIDLDEVQPAVPVALRAPLAQPEKRVTRADRAPAPLQGARVFRPPRPTFV